MPLLIKHNSPANKQRYHQPKHHSPELVFFCLFYFFSSCIAANTLSGTVTDAITGNPLPNIQVHSTSETYGVSVATDVNGQYSISSLPEGEYRVYTEKNPYQATNASYIPMVYDNQACLWYCRIMHTQGLPVSVVTDSNTESVDFAMIKGGQIAGYITDLVSGEPLSDTKVAIFDENGLISGYARSDTTGYYFSQGLPDGQYYVTVSSEHGYFKALYGNIICDIACVATDAAPLTVMAEQITPADFNLTQGSSVTGHIYDAVTGEPVPFIQVKVYNEASEFIAAGFSGMDGQYRINSALSSGEYFIYAYGYSPSYSSGSEMVAEKHYLNQSATGRYCELNDCTKATEFLYTLPSIDLNPVIDFQLDKGLAISGTIVNATDQLPVEGVQVTISRVDQSTQTIRITSANGVTDANGYYTSDKPLGAGSYYVAAVFKIGNDNPYFPGISCEPECTVILFDSEVALSESGEASHVNFEIGLDASQTGTVTSNVIANIENAVFNSNVVIAPSTANLSIISVEGNVTNIAQITTGESAVIGISDDIIITEPAIVAEPTTIAVSTEVISKNDTIFINEKDIKEDIKEDTEEVIPAVASDNNEEETSSSTNKLMLGAVSNVFFTSALFIMLCVRVSCRLRKRFSLQLPL